MLRITIRRKVTAIVALTGPVAGENNNISAVPEGKITATVALEKATSEGESAITVFLGRYHSGRRREASSGYAVSVYVHPELADY